MKNVHFSSQFERFSGFFKKSNWIERCHVLKQFVTSQKPVFKMEKDDKMSDSEFLFAEINCGYHNILLTFFNVAILVITI